MNYVKLCAFLQFVKNDTVGFADIARVRGVERQAIAKSKQREISQEEIIEICEAFGVKPPTNVDNISFDSNDFGMSTKIKIPYWEGCEENPSLLKSPLITTVKLEDMEIVQNKWNKNPENLRIIAMPSDKMNGNNGDNIPPFNLGDILLIDISQNDINSSGIYAFTTNNGVFINRISKRFDNSVVFSFSNPLEQDVVISLEDLEKLEFKVIGRVFLNYFYSYS